MKYVIEKVTREDVSHLRVHVFSEDISHDEFPKHKYGKAISAGYCHLAPQHGVVASGRSITLKLRPNLHDTTILSHFFAGSFESQRFLLADLYE